MAKKALITGSEGMLAYDLARVWGERGYQVIGLSHAQLDITQQDQVRRAIGELKPDIVFTTPGIGVDTCESQPAKGFKLHTWGAANVARQCEQVGASCVYISTCGLFGDEVKFYSEYDQVQLKTQYARSKFMGEEASIQHCSRTFIVRPGWLFGGTVKHRRNFVYQRYQEALQTPLLSSASDKFGCPTFTQDLAAKMLEVVESEEYGRYHITNSGSASRYDYVKCIVESFSLDTEVEPVDSLSFPRSAPVPDCETLENLNVKFLGLNPMEPWQDAIKRYVDSLKSESML